jgi:hypothetical protein
MSKDIYDRELEHLKGVEQSYGAQSNTAEIKRRGKEVSETKSRQLVAISLAYISICLLIAVNLFVPRSDNSTNIPSLITNLRSQSGLVLFGYAVFGYIALLYIMKYVAALQEAKDRSKYIQRINASTKIILNKWFGIPVFLGFAFLTWRHFDLIKALARALLN